MSAVGANPQFITLALSWFQPLAGALGATTVATFNYYRKRRSTSVRRRHGPSELEPSPPDGGWTRSEGSSTMNKNSPASRAAIMIAGYDPGYLRITEHQVRKELSAGRTPVVLDATSISGGGTSSYDRGALKFFRLDYPGHDLRQRMERLGVDVLEIPDFIDEPSTELLDSEREEVLAIAVQSALITYFRTDQPNRSKRAVRKTAKELAHEGRGVYRGVSAILRANPEIDLVYLPNGRFPHQKMAYIASNDAGVATLHFEKGETPHGSYLQDYAPQNRLASQGAVEPLLAALSHDEVEGIADAWLARRAPSHDSSNEFAALWAQDLPQELTHLADADTRIAGFFTSSQDEFQFLGPEWQLHEWKDQFEAFDAVLSEFEKAGYMCYLRVHPNLATKAQDCFQRERAGIRRLSGRHPNLLVIWHDDFANTYSLLDVTDAVVVWDSTVGLEASARGIPVWTMATSRYGLVADVREILSADDLKAKGLEPWKVDSHAAKRFIAYLMLRDDPMDPEYEPWLPWDATNPPFGSKIAAALLAGGTPYRSEAIKSILDVYRHRSVSSNLRHLRRR